MRKYVLGIILALLLGFFGIFNADTMALDSDYKNNLLKVDLVKAGDDNYKLELFTQKPYSEPVKVIQKSETSYYVLLPETYHSITSVPVSGDITKVDVKLYPYAGQDLNNGYTKINISTAKPLTFSTNVKTSSASKPQIDSKKLAQLDKAFDSKGAAGKNIPVKVDTTKNVPVQTAKTQTPKVAEPVKVAVQPAQKEVVKKVDTNVASEPVKVAIAPKNVQTAVQGQPKPAGSTEIEIVTKPKVQEPIKQQEIAPSGDTNPVSLEEVLETEATGDDELAMEQDAIDQGLTEIATGEDEPIPVLTKKQRVKQAVKALVMTLTENFLLVIAIILLIIALVLLSKGKQAEGDEKSYGYAAKDGEIGGDGGFGTVQPVEPVAGEYPVYEPGLEPAVAANANANEGYEPQMAPVYEEASVATAEEETNDEADVLATESFGENRGLCLVNYDGSIALIGYIEEEIFVIQNFGKITLLNPSIQIRVAEQNDNDTIYIVKTANSKLMVRETKELIGLEMVM